MLTAMIVLHLFLLFRSLSKHVLLFQENRLSSLEDMEECFNRLCKSVYSFEELQQRPLPDGVNPNKLETYLSDQQFSVSWPIVYPILIQSTWCAGDNMITRARHTVHMCACWQVTVLLFTDSELIMKSIGGGGSASITHASLVIYHSHVYNVYNFKYIDGNSQIHRKMTFHHL